MYNSDEYDPYGQPYTPYPYQPPHRSPFTNLGGLRSIVGVLFTIGAIYVGRSGMFSPTVQCSKELLVVQEKYDEIISACTDAINSNSDNAFAYNNRALGYSGKQQYDLAIADFNKAIELEPSDPISYVNLGGTYLDMSDDTNAIEQFTKAIQVKPSDPDAYVARAWTYYDENKLDLAMSDVEAALKHDPFSGDAFHLRGLLYMEQEDYKHAVSDLKIAKNMNPTDIYVLFDSATANMYIDETDTAIADLQKVLVLTDDTDLKSIAQDMLDDLQGD